MRGCNGSVVFCISVYALACVLIGFMSAGAAQAQIDRLFPGVSFMNPQMDAGQSASSAGLYLAGRAAQQAGDWSAAYDFTRLMDGRADTLEDGGRRALILAVGSGRFDDALVLTMRGMEDDDTGGLVSLFLLLHVLQSDKTEVALKFLRRLDQIEAAHFLRAPLQGWLKGDSPLPEALAISDRLMMLVMREDFAALESLIAAPAVIDALTPAQRERIADWLVQKKQTALALTLYRTLEPESDPFLATKLERLLAARGLDGVPMAPLPSLTVQAIGVSLYDIATLLYREQALESARLFAQLSLYANGDLHESRLLLAALAIDHGRLSDAVFQLRQIPAHNRAFGPVQIELATLFAENGERDAALETLAGLRDHPEHAIEALIVKGNMHREAQDYVAALTFYQQARAALPDKVPAAYTHLPYLMGIALERLNRWEEAEASLKEALEFRPDDPYVLNYLAYGWLERGENIPEVLAMLERAAALKPSNGAILDSLGWALFTVGRLPEAALKLEAAAALLPDDPTINDHLGDVYWHLGRPKEAAFQWRRAISDLKDDPETYAVVARKLDTGLAPVDHERVRMKPSAEWWETVMHWLRDHGIQ